MTVFLLSVVAAVTMLILALSKDVIFYNDLNLLNSSKLCVIRFQNVQILTRELVSLSNGELSEFSVFSLPKSNASYNVSNSDFLQSEILA